MASHTPIADLVQRLLSTGIPPEAVVAAVRAAEQHAQSVAGADPVAAKRRAYDRERKRRRAAEIPPEIPPERAAGPPPSNGSPKPPPITTPSTDDGAVRARLNLISPEARVLADQIALIAGHKLDKLPTTWAGAAERVDYWLRAGWREPLILETARAVMRRHGGGRLPMRVQYFEQAIAEAHAAVSAPLPTAEATHAQRPLNLVGAVRPGRGSTVAVLDRVIAGVRAQRESG